MAASKDLFMKMSEEYYLSIPPEITQVYLADKVYSESENDYAELMDDKAFRDIDKLYKEVKKDRNERMYQLREEKRKQLNK